MQLSVHRLGKSCSQAKCTLCECLFTFPLFDLTAGLMVQIVLFHGHGLYFHLLDIQTDTQTLTDALVIMKAGLYFTHWSSSLI